MMYIHQSTCISAQRSFLEPDLDQLVVAIDNKLKVIEPDYKDIPPGLLRRMGKAVRMGVGAGLPLLSIAPGPSGIILGTANGGMEDCIKFLNQVIQYDEGMLTPGNFVQSTPNAIASQISLLHANRSYNITHVHRGLAFENALMDALMQVRVHPSKTFLFGAVDEISDYNFNIDFLGGWYKKEKASNAELYQTSSAGSIAGEGAALFLVNGIKTSSFAKVKSVRMLHTLNEMEVRAALQDFLARQDTGIEKIDLFLTGENGDNRMLKYYETCEGLFEEQTGIARFKHMSGEFPTASAIALWVSCQILQSQILPEHMIKRAPTKHSYNQILLYNNYKGVQHSFILVAAG